MMCCVCGWKPASSVYLRRFFARMPELALRQKHWGEIRQARILRAWKCRPKNCDHLGMTVRAICEDCAREAWRAWDLTPPRSRGEA